ncbi:beta strand repeat-containing protein [Bradyrhizobium diazoefficiens]|nr:hypothetical protein XF15B_24090 [Bradyrhizobium diazoefficiens]
MSLSDAALFAALCEEAYQRAPEDSPFQTSDIFPDYLPAFTVPKSLIAPGLVTSSKDTGMVYSSTGTGFAAMVLKNGDSYIVVFRGTDIGNFPFNLDSGDLSNDIHLGFGTLDGQLADLKNLMNLLASQVGSANITVAGQSLGGGLALLAGSMYGSKTYAYDPAPFGTTLWVNAAYQAALDLNIGGVIPESICKLFPAAQQAQLQQYLIQGKLTQQQINAFIGTEQAIYSGFLANLANPNLTTAYRVDHEILSTSANWISWGISEGAVRFDSPAMYAPLGGVLPSTGPLVVHTLEAGLGDGTFDDSMSLHHPALLALLIKEATLGGADPIQTPFGSLTQSDGVIRHALWDEGQLIAGPNDNSRDDPKTIGIPDQPPIKISSWIKGGDPQSGILYRALWLDDDFRAHFEEAFNRIEHGAAGAGLKSTTFDPADTSIHRALVELGLRVVRDSIQSSGGDTGSDTTDSGNSDIAVAGRYVFDPLEGGNDTRQNGDSYAIVRLADIRANGLRDRMLIDTDRTLVDDVFLRKLSASSWDAPNLTAPGSKPEMDWKVLVVQTGDYASMNYKPTSDVENLSHMIIGGNGHPVIGDSGPVVMVGDTIRGSSATDFIAGGDGNDTFILGGYASGDGLGSYISGGLGYDTVDYSNVHVSINYGDSNYLHPSDSVSLNPFGPRHDIVSGVEAIIGSKDASLTNYFDLDQTHPLLANGESGFVSLTLYAGTNYITGATGGSLNVDGEGGFNVLYLPWSRSAYTLTKTDTGWRIGNNFATHPVHPELYDWILKGVQVVYFQGTPYALDHYGEDQGAMSIDFPASNVSNLHSSYKLSDLDSDHHTVTVERYGSGGSHGTLTAAVDTETSESFVANPNNTVSVRHNPGQIVLDYTPDPNAKYSEYEYYAVTVSNDKGKAYTFYVNEVSPGSSSSPTASLAQGNAASAMTEVNGSSATSVSGAVAIADTDPTDIETAGFSFVSSTASSLPRGDFSAAVVSDAGGGSHVQWSYIVDAATFSGMSIGTSFQETYQVWVTDQHGGRSQAQNITVNVNAKTSATTQVTSADTSATVVQGQDAYGYQVASGKILIADADLKEMHSVSTKSIGTSGNPGAFSATVVSDTNGSGYGEIDWQYAVQNSTIGPIYNGPHSYDIAISDGRGGTIHQTVTVTTFGFNPFASPIFSAPRTLTAQSGAPVSETDVFTDANFIVHHSLAVAPLDQTGSDWGQLSATLIQDTTWPTPGTGSYSLTYTPSLLALDALQDGQTHVEHWQVSLVGDNGKSASQTLTVVVGRPPNQTAIDPSASTVSGLLVADTHQTTTETANGSVAFVDSIATDMHVLTATFLSSDGGSSPIGSLTAALGADTTGGSGSGHADWTYEAANSALEALSDGLVVHEVWQLALDDGHGGTTLQNVTISLSKTVPNTAPVVTTTSSDVFAQVTEAAATTGSQAHDQASGTISFADPDAGDAPTATVSSLTTVYLDAAGHPVDLTSAQQAALAGAFSIAAAPTNGQSGTITWTFSPTDADLDFLSRSEVIQVKAVVTLDDGHGHVVDTPVSILVHGTDDAPTVATIDAGTVAETATPVAIDLLQSSWDPDRADTLHLGSVTTATSSDGHVVAVDVSDHGVTLDPQQFAYLGRNDQTTVTIQFSVSNGQLASPGTATLVVTGTNEAPSVAQQDAVRIDQNAGLTDISLLASASDADTTDTLSLGPNSVSVVSSDGHQVQFTQSADGLQIDPSQFSYLADGEQISFIINYTVTDGLVSTSGQQTVIVTGENDAPTVAPIAAGTVSERDSVQSIDLLQGASDPDHGAVLSVSPQSVSISSSDGHATVGTLTGSVLAIDPSDFLYLHQGQSAVLTVHYAVTDGITSTRNTATLTVTGADSLPTITPFDVGSADQNDPVQTIDLLQTASDPDGKDALTVVGTPIVTEANGHLPMELIGAVYVPMTHDVAFSYANGVLSIAPSQFSFLKAGQTDVVTISYDITDGTTILHNTATMTVVGETDLSVHALVLAGTTQSTGSYSFNGLANASSPDQGVTYQYALVAGSVSATSSDGHAVSVGNVSGSPTITMDRSQFGYLGVGDATTVTFQYDVSIVGSSAPAIHTTASVVVAGTNDVAPAVTPPAAILTDTSAKDVFDPITGRLVVVDPDIHDGQFWTLYNQSPADSVVVGSMAAVLVRPDGTYVLIPSSKAINAMKSGQTSEGYFLRDNDGSGGNTLGTINVSYVAADDTPSSPYFNTGGAVLEHAANGTSVGTLKVLDPDTSDTVTWSLVDNAGGRFALSTGGALTVVNGTLLDHADTAGYDIVVKATDAGGQYVQQAVHVGLLQIATATILGTSGADTLTGTAGNDVIVGLAGSDTINAGAGDDLVLPGAGANHSDGGAGTDTISYVDTTIALVANLATGTITHGGTSDTATNFENIIATTLDDTIYGTSGANVIDAGAGNDKIYGRGGADTIDGGPGTDTVYFDDATAGVTVNLQSGSCDGAAAGTTIANVEAVVGSSFNDVLTGLATAASAITAGAGDDIITTGSGDDTIDSGTGHDIVYGSLGADTITDLDDLVLDYSASPSSVVLYAGTASSGTNYGYLGIGGLADGDNIHFGDSAHLGTAKLELHLTDYADGVRLNPYDINTVYAGAGDDNIYVKDSINFAVQSKETIYGGDGYDIIHPGNDGYDVIDFGAGGGILDYQTTTGYVNFVWAEPGGTSTVEVYSGTTTANIADHGQTLVTGSFETFEGGSLADTIFGNSQDNWIFGNGGDDYIDAGAGNDHISGSGTVHGGAGNDMIYVTGGTTNPSNIYGDDGNDSILVSSSTSALTVWGGAGDDVIDVSSASTGDIVHGGAGADVIRMGYAFQTISYSDSTSAIWISGSTGKAGDAMGDTIIAPSSVKLVGSDHGDAFENTNFELHLGSGDNVVINNTGAVYGNTGNDTIIGTSLANGPDVIHTGGGHDFLDGNAGNDQFYFDHPGSNDQATLQYARGDGQDTIYGFTHGLDTIDLVLAGGAAPTVTTTVANGNTTVHVAWDSSHSDSIVLNGVQLSSFVLNQDYHLV